MRQNAVRMRAMPSETIRVTGQPIAEKGLHILTVRGAITYATCPAVVEAVQGVAEPKLILVMTEVPSVDSMAVGALVRIYVHCQKSSRRLALVGMNSRIENILRLTGVDPLFDTYATLAEAEAALR
jgi:anti-sigma B factor antagonist